MKNKFIILIVIIVLIIVSYQIVLSNIDLDIKQIPSSTIIYDNDWFQIWEIINSSKYRHIENNIKDYPEFLKSAIIMLEDKSFYDNDGISYKSLIRAFLKNIKSGTIVEWASTISSQYIRNISGLNKQRTLNRKISEFIYALALNKQYDKDQILEKYLNILYFWYLNYWFESASRYYFNKSLNNLTKSEQIALITIPKNPSKYDPYKNFPLFFKRYNMLIDYYKKNWLIDDYEYTSIKNEKLIFNENHGNKMPYYIDFLKNYKNKKLNWKDNKIFNVLESSILESTIDYDLTNEIENMAESTLKNLSWKWVTDYGVIILDKKTNQLKVMIWWYDYYEDIDAWKVNSTLALRQMWSSLKPFTYVLAFKNLWLKPNDTITDLPIQFETSRWFSYTPKNYSLKYKGEVTLANALAESLNVPAIKVASLVWVWNLLEFYRSLWMSSLDKDADYYWLSLTLWVWEVNLYEIVRAYTIFSNDWNLCDIVSIKWEISDCKNIIEKKYVDDVISILTNRYFKINWFPINSNLDFPDRYVFVKTWTSREFRDNVAVWFTDNYMIWVWVWNKSWEKMKMVTWVIWAGEIFRKIVYFLEKDYYKSVPSDMKPNISNYVEIISPVHKSKYKKENNIWYNENIKLEFNTNIYYDTYQWIYDWNLFTWEFLWLEKWGHDLRLILFDWSWKVWESESKFIVE